MRKKIASKVTWNTKNASKCVTCPRKELQKQSSTLKLNAENVVLIKSNAKFCAAYVTFSLLEFFVYHLFVAFNMRFFFLRNFFISLNYLKQRKHLSSERIRDSVMSINININRLVEFSSYLHRKDSPKIRNKYVGSRFDFTKIYPLRWNKAAEKGYTKIKTNGKF